MAISLNIGKIGYIAEKLEDINDFIHKKLTLFPIDHISDILKALYNSNKTFLQSYFTLGYYGLQNQLNDDMKTDVIQKMDDFRSWSKREVKNSLKLSKLADLGQALAQNNRFEESIHYHLEMLKLDPDNYIAMIALASLYKRLGNISVSNQYLAKYKEIKKNPPVKTGRLLPKFRK